jgi:uncharacterized protein affecting Mg2+/Co2+ transport
MLEAGVVKNRSWFVVAKEGEKYDRKEFGFVGRLPHVLLGTTPEMASESSLASVSTGARSGRSVTPTRLGRKAACRIGSFGVAGGLVPCCRV